MIKIRQENWNEVPAERKRAFLRMTLRDGMMRDYVRKTSPIVLTAYLNSAKGKKAGWAILHPTRADSMFFVQHDCRGKGVGMALIDAVIKLANQLNIPKVEVYPHDYLSQKLMYKARDKHPGRLSINWGTDCLETEFGYETHYSYSDHVKRKLWK